MMSNHNFPHNSNLTNATEEYDGVVYRRDENNELVVVEQVLPAPNLASEIMRSQEVVQHKVERSRRFSKPTIFTLGALAVTLVASPAIVHAAAESATHAIMNYAKGSTAELTQDDLIEDLNISIRKMMGGS